MSYGRSNRAICDDLEYSEGHSAVAGLKMEFVGHLCKISHDFNRHSALGGGFLTIMRYTNPCTHSLTARRAVPRRKLSFLLCVLFEYPNILANFRRTKVSGEFGYRCGRLGDLIINPEYPTIFSFHPCTDCSHFRRLDSRLFRIFFIAGFMSHCR